MAVEFHFCNDAKPSGATNELHAMQAEIDRLRAVERHLKRELEACRKQPTNGHLGRLLELAGGKKALLHLVHPDKHNGCRAANDVTAYIISHC